MEMNILADIRISTGVLDNGPSVDPPYPEDALPEPVSAIRLAREHNITSILPAAFYQLSRLPIIDDMTRSSEGVEAPGTAEWNLLTADDLRCLLSMQEKLKWAMIWFLLQYLNHSSDAALYNNSTLIWRLLFTRSLKCSWSINAPSGLSRSAERWTTSLLPTSPT
ncbi:hypothetical protein BYT27DRAFT_6966023 [Phlegmacium glaucopus]|nr:hypothetical protein BYT27DRAFT_6966023 [Phlegmacium glaucopus]